MPTASELSIPPIINLSVHAIKNWTDCANISGKETLNIVEYFKISKLASSWPLDFFFNQNLNDKKDNDDTLTIYIEEKDYSDGIVEYLGLKFENGDIKQSKIQKLNLIEPDEEELDMFGFDEDFEAQALGFGSEEELYGYDEVPMDGVITFVGDDYSGQDVVFIDDVFNTEMDDRYGEGWEEFTDEEWYEIDVEEFGQEQVGRRRRDDYTDGERRIPLTVQTP